jgi:hypothetical protein
MEWMRIAGRPCSSRSNTVLPMSTSNWLPKFSATAAATQGVAKSNDIGPLANRSHSPPATSMHMAAAVARPMHGQRIHRDCIARNGGLASRRMICHQSVAPTRLRHQPRASGRTIDDGRRPPLLPPPQAGEGRSTDPAPVAGEGGGRLVASALRRIRTFPSTVRKPVVICLLSWSTAMLAGMSLLARVTIGG